MTITLPPNQSQNPAEMPRRARLLIWAKLLALGVSAYIVASPFFFHFIGATIAQSGKPPRLPLAAIVALSGLEVSFGIALAIWAFIALGPQLGLDSPVLRGVRRLREVLLPAIFAGSIAALSLLCIQRGFRPFLPSVLSKPAGGSAMGGPLLGISASFYGGIIEEMMMRLGLMTLLAYALSKIRVPISAALIIANIASAVLFGVGHLPAARALGIPFTPTLVAYIILTNAVGGIIFGWLYAKRGAEAAMVGHFTADIWLHVLLQSLLA